MASFTPPGNFGPAASASVMATSRDSVRGVSITTPSVPRTVRLRTGTSLPSKATAAV